MIFTVIGFVFISLFLFLLFKDKRSDLGVLILLITGISIFTYCIFALKDLIDFINEIAKKANIDSLYISIVLKILAIAYISTFSSEICKDAGATSLASKVELSGKIIILILAIPILRAVLDSIIKIL